MVFEDNENLSEFASNQEDGFNDEVLAEQGFENISPKILRRANSDKNTYKVYSDEQSFERIVVESIINGINEGTIKSPYKIINTHSRIPDILVAQDLEEVSQKVIEPQQSDEQPDTEQEASAETPEDEISKTEALTEKADDTVQDDTNEVESSAVDEEKGE